MIAKLTSSIIPASMVHKPASGVAVALNTRDPSWTSRQADEALLDEVST
jgi:hypothetical protein